MRGMLVSAKSFVYALACVHGKKILEDDVELISFLAVDSLRVLPAIFNGGFELKEKKARQKLKEVLDTDMGRPRKR